MILSIYIFYPVSIEFEPVSLDIIKKNAVIFTIALQDLTSNCGEVVDRESKILNFY